MKKPVRIIIAIAIFQLLACGLVNSLFANTTTLTPEDMGGLRMSYGKVYVLGLDSVKWAGNAVQEDRTIAHYDISTINWPITQATLDIPIQNRNSGTGLDSFAVYAFNGDGVVSWDEFDMGALAHVFTGIVRNPNTTTLQLDVTAILQNAAGAHAPFVSFNFRPVSGTDSYYLGPDASLSDPTLTITPEPATLLLLGLGGLVLRKR